MNNNIIKFYFMATALKNKIRTGWQDVKIEKERLESVAEHVYGCLILAIAIIGEHNLDLDLSKVLKMISLHELEECIIPDFSYRASVSEEEKLKLGKDAVHEVVQNLTSGNEIECLLDEFNEKKTKEAKFCYLVDKLECDIQAKSYDLEGVFNYEMAKKDAEFYGDRKDEIIKKAKTASDFWLLYDEPKYKDDEIFKSIIDDLIKG